MLSEQDKDTLNLLDKKYSGDNALGHSHVGRNVQWLIYKIYELDRKQTVQTHTAPSQYDVRDEGVKVPIRDQGDLGSGVDHAAVTTVETAMQKEEHLKQTQFRGPDKDHVTVRIEMIRVYANQYRGSLFGEYCLWLIEQLEQARKQLDERPRYLKPTQNAASMIYTRLQGLEQVVKSALDLAGKELETVKSTIYPYTGSGAADTSTYRE